MGKRKYIVNRRVDDFLQGVTIFIVIGICGWVYQNKDKIQSYFYLFLVAAVVLLLVAIGVLLFLKKRKKSNNEIYLDETRLFNSFKGGSPNDFEREVADIFSGLGYETKTVGGSHDGGVDIEAKKDNELYLIQCKRWTQAKAGVQDVRQLHSAVHRENAKKGFFVALSGFTLEAETELGNDLMMELIDGKKLISLYKLAKIIKK